MRVLIVDDEAPIRETLGAALELEGLKWDGAGSIAEAKARLGRRPSLVLLDLRLPDGDGLELMPELGGVPVVVMSGHGTIEDAVRAIQAGARDFLEKPVGTDRLLVTLSNVAELDRLSQQNEDLARELARERGAMRMVGQSALMQQLQAQIDRVASSEGRVLITGENGSGKELVARAVHERSPRAKGPFVSLNCGAVPSELIEAELFGHEKGAFTGADRRRPGRFERADGGTLFLDEVADMPASMQVKLLRVLQTGELEPVGGVRSIKVDVRVLAATNKDLEAEVEAGRFREDLFYRLAVVPIRVPPLRARADDIPRIAEVLLEEAAVRNRRPRVALDSEAMRILTEHDYPGNVRELRNLIERIVILAPPGRATLGPDDVLPLMPTRRAGPQGLWTPGRKLSDQVADLERRIVEEALAAENGSIPAAARALGIERSNFHKKLKALGLK